MKVLVTGSGGFVGSALVDHLRALGHDVTGLSREAREGSVQADLLDPASLTRALTAIKPKTIVHLAAQTDLKGEATAYDANVQGVANLLAAVAASPDVRRVIWSSSQLVAKPGQPPKSDTDFDPVGGYGQSKAEGERLVRAADGGGKQWVITRSTTIWGPGMADHYTALLRHIDAGRYFHIGSAPLRKSYSYIGNLVSQIAALVTAPAEQVQGRVFYLADSDPIELRSWADGFAVALNRRIPTLPRPLARIAALGGDVLAKLGLPAPLTSARLDNMLTQYLYDTGPIEAVHGATMISNDEGVRRTAAWYREAKR
jgi:nucleoside-diphosphate-sugar epimerase